MAGSCITVSNTAENSAVWNGQPPEDFTTDLAVFQTDYGTTFSKAAQAAAAAGGAADVKALAERALEDAAYLLARALAVHYKKTGDLDNRAKVDLSKTEIVQLRQQDLLTKTTVIRDLGTEAQAQPGATGRGVTAARVSELAAAIEGFRDVMNAPRGQIVNRGTLIKEVETDVAALMEQLRDLDDLVLQFGGSEAGDRFVAAWQRARIIVDTGGGHGNGGTTVAPAKTPAP